MMKRCHATALRRHLRRVCVGIAALLLSTSAPAQSARERAQSLQMQQQMQKLRQENAQLATALQQSKAEAADAEKLKTDVEQTRQEAARLKAIAAAGQQGQQRSARELDKARAELGRSQAEAEQLKAELARRAETLQQASAALDKERRGAENERNVLGRRLSFASTRAEVCEAQHAKALGLGGELVDVLERERTRVCEPFTGLWRVREEQRVQTWRDRLFDSRLDAVQPPRAAASGAEPARP